MGRLTTPTVLREVCVDKSLASSLGSWDPKSPSPFRRRECISIETARLRKALVEVYTNRCDPMAARKDISTARPWMVDIRRAAPAEFRSAFLRERYCLLPLMRPGLQTLLAAGGRGPIRAELSPVDGGPVARGRGPSKAGGRGAH